jgi:hypothetical protein
MRDAAHVDMLLSDTKPIAACQSVAKDAPRRLTELAFPVNVGQDLSKLSPAL